MKICICVNTLLENDAIGNDVAGQWSVLDRAGMRAAVFTDICEQPQMAGAILDDPAMDRFIEQPENLLIYHLAGAWDKGLELLQKARCRVMVKYHNITPPAFFRSYANYENFCTNGRVQMKIIAGLEKVERFLCDSWFNAQDFEAQGVGRDRICIVPPFHRLDDFEQVEIDPGLARTLDDQKVNLMFVGRVVPSKGHPHLIAVAARYTAMYDRALRLVIIGKIDPSMGAYLDELNRQIHSHHLQDIVSIKNAVSFQELHTCYSACHGFLLMSLHEGFCLPVLEAQYHGLPIIALKAGAVPETMGSNQLVLDTPDYTRFAAAVHLLYKDPGVRQYLAEQGRQNLSRFSTTVLEAAFLAAVGSQTGETA